MTRKTDSEIEQWVLRELSLSKKVCSQEICVFARDGVVTLRGSAQSYQDKLAVEDATRGATGVVGVLNEMRVKPSAAPFTQSPRPGLLIPPMAIQRTAVKTTAA